MNFSLENSKIWYKKLNKSEIKELLAWMHTAARVTYRNDDGTEFNEEFYTFWQHFNFLKKFAQEKGIKVYATYCPRGMIEMTFPEVISIYLDPMRYSRHKKSISKKIILDFPRMKYFSLISNVEEIVFLCGEKMGHLITNLREFGIKFRFLDIPVKNWDSWKARPEYKGEK